MNFSDALSVEAWVNPSSVGVTSEIVGRASQFMLRLDSSKESSTVSLFVVINGIYEPRAKGVVLPENEWSFVVGTFDGSKVKTYVNGQLVGSVARSGHIDIATNAVTIGNVNGNYFNGSISNVRLFNRVLSAD